MFLLIRKDGLTIETVNSFTFHNVSINTLQAKKDERIAILFTFHNVSINTS